MRTFSSLLATLTLALLVSAKPTTGVHPRDSFVSLAIHKNAGTDASSVSRNAANRVGQLQGRQVDLEGTDNQFFYSIDVKIGEPPLVYGLAVDTASGNTWVGAGRAFINSTTTVQTDNTLSLALTRAWPAFESAIQVDGYEVLDKLAITPDLVIQQQSIGVATSISADWMPRGDGPFGIGPTSSTQGTLSPDAEIPTILDNLISQGAITSKVAGVSFNVSQSAASTVDGELTLGGIDSSRYIGDLTYVPVTSAAPSSKYWGVDAAVRYGDGTELLSATAGIIDSASVLNFLSTDALEQYVNATGAVWDEDAGLYSLTPAQYAKIQSLYLEVGGAVFELTPNAQIWPRSQERGLFGTTDRAYLLMGDLGTPSGQGLDFVLGMPALERLYTVLDSDNKRVGFATTPYSFVEVK